MLVKNTVDRKNLTIRARWLENLVKENNWKQGVEIGVFKGTTKRL